MKPIPWLDQDSAFPSTREAATEPNGLLAAGADLSPRRLVDAYSRGIFPWFDDDQPILWWTPEPRAVIYTDKVKVSRSLRKTLNQNRYRVTINCAFNAVIQACADDPRGRNNPEDQGTWITSRMIDAFVELHQLGIAHSVECWQEETLCGGLYGISLGRMFFGESMFSRKNDASKVALVHLAGLLHQFDYPMIDCQVENPHLISLGADLISRELFEQTLTTNVARSPQDIFAPRELDCWPN